MTTRHRSPLRLAGPPRGEAGAALVVGLILLLVLTLLATQGGSTVTQNFMLDAPIKGTTEWKRYTITLPVPAAADRVEVGMMLRGKGTVWLDDVELEIVDP